MVDNLREIVGRHASKGVIVDTNILVLFVVGCFDPRRIPLFKRTCQFEIADFELLVRFLEGFQRRVTTPAILAETSNFVSQLKDPARESCLRMLGKVIGTLDERYVAGRNLVEDELFLHIGITDMSIHTAANDGLLVLTDDYRLSNRLQAGGSAAINFNHIRTQQAT